MNNNWQNKVIALTGSIGSGKSSALKIFNDLGAFTLSADDLAYKLSEKDSEGLKKIVALFGVGILKDSKELDRGKLAKIVFGDRKKKELLEALLHPMIQKLAEDTFKAAFKKNYPLYVYEIPLLFETAQEKNFKKVVLITAPKNLCLERYIMRSGASHEEAERRMNSQMPVEEKIKAADFVIDNAGSLGALKDNVAACFGKLSSLRK